APSAKGDDKFITTDYLQQCPSDSILKSCRDAISGIMYSCYEWVLSLHQNKKSKSYVFSRM
ncbi:hypothetical protein ACH673_13365, partial [Klebsiella pneumoniae]